jgi:hypothetical protein
MKEIPPVYDDKYCFWKFDSIKVYNHFISKRVSKKKIKKFERLMDNRFYAIFGLSLVMPRSITMECNFGIPYSMLPTRQYKKRPNANKETNPKTES